MAQGGGVVPARGARLRPSCPLLLRAEACDVHMLHRTWTGTVQVVTPVGGSEPRPPSAIQLGWPEIGEELYM
jgi:hypothetical protein